MELINVYHKLTIEETLKSLDVNPETGLSDKEASQRIAHTERHGDGSSFWKFAGNAIARPVIILLLVAATLSAVLGGLYESLLILAVIILHTVLSARLKKSGQRSIDRAISSSVTHAIVLRNGAKMKLPSDELAVGDVVTLKPGRVVPADLRLINCEGLVTDESALTGNSRVVKDCDMVNTADLPPERRGNCAFEGTVVVKGRGDGVVIATGMSTEMSRLTLPLDVPEKDESPAFSRISRLSKLFTFITVLGCIVVFILSLVYDKGFLSSAVASLALAVAVVPEGIGTSVLTAIAKGAERLKAHGFSAKTMRAVETLGEVSVFTTDIPKMGVAATYTNGRIHTPQEEDTVPFLEGLLLCELKNSSLRTYASHKCDAENIIAEFPKIGEFMGEVTTTLHRAGETTISYTGGEADEILSRSKLIWDFGHIRTLTNDDRAEIAECIRGFAEEGYSITALGLRSGDDVPRDTNLIFLGIAATRAEESVPSTPDTSKLQEAGIRVYLMTESDAEKARLGASALGLSVENIVCGRDLENMDDEALVNCLKNNFVFASLRAQDKVRIINILKSRGMKVVSIGDTMNDAPALDASDIGMCDIHAQDAAKDASDVIFDGTESADEAVLFGKTIRTNIKKIITYLTAANLAELLCVLVSSLCGFGFPITPSQMLLINLVTDTFPPIILAKGSQSCKKVFTTGAYIWGAILGIVCVAVFKILCGMIPELLAQWIVCALLALGEFLLAIPIYFCGRK